MRGRVPDLLERTHDGCASSPSSRPDTGPGHIQTSHDRREEAEHREDAHDVSHGREPTRECDRLTADRFARKTPPLAAELMPVLISIGLAETTRRTRWVGRL